MRHFFHFCPLPLKSLYKNVMLYEHSALFLMVDSILEQKNFNWISQGETVKKHLSKATKDLLDTLHLSFSTMEKKCVQPHCTSWWPAAAPWTFMAFRSRIRWGPPLELGHKVLLPSSEGLKQKVVGLSEYSHHLPQTFLFISIMELLLSTDLLNDDMNPMLFLCIY